jgi:hypothetical protein
LDPTPQHSLKLIPSAKVAKEKLAETLFVQRVYQALSGRP